MIICKCEMKYKDKNGKIIGYRLVDDRGNKIEYEPQILKDSIRKRILTVVNLTLTTDGRLIDGTGPRKSKEKTLGEVYTSYNLGKYESLSVNDPRVIRPYRDANFKIKMKYKNDMVQVEHLGKTKWETLDDIVKHPDFYRVFKNAIIIAKETVLLPKNIQTLPNGKIATDKTVEEANRLIRKLNNTVKRWLKAGNVFYSQHDGIHGYHEDGLYSFVKMNYGEKEFDNDITVKFNQTIGKLKELETKYAWLDRECPKFKKEDIDAKYIMTDMFSNTDDYYNNYWEATKGYWCCTNNKEFAERHCASIYESIIDMLMDTVQYYMNEKKYSLHYKELGLTEKKPESGREAYKSIVDLPKLINYVIKTSEEDFFDLRFWHKGLNVQEIDVEKYIKDWVEYQCSHKKGHGSTRLFLN